MTIALNGSDLTVTQVVAAARHGEAVTLAIKVYEDLTRTPLRLPPHDRGQKLAQSGA